MVISLDESTEPSFDHMTESCEYRMLTLNGGGVRGILQATFLRHLEEDVGNLVPHFDLIAATSTGALIGLGLAAGISAKDITDLYKDHIPKVFRRRAGSVVRRGSRYNSSPLRHLLEDAFGDRRLGELDVEVVISASELNRYEGRLFTREDANTKLVDVALASAAAPTYFTPVVPYGSDRGYVDGGLWANDPLLAAVGHAVGRHQISPQAIAALSIGTGQVVRGTTPAELTDMRRFSIDAIRFFLEMTGSLQEWGVRYLLRQLAPRANVRRINPVLPRRIKLDDAKTALEVLPGVAESEYAVHRADLRSWLATERGLLTVPPLDPTLEAGLREAKVSKFIPARRFYKEYRGPNDSIGSYISLAQRTVTMVSINLATGRDLERIERVFQEMIERDVPVRIRVSLLDYDDPALMEAVCSILGARHENTARDIAETMASLIEFRRSLDESLRTYIELFLHRTIPSASAILLDANSPTGRIQLETKPYKAPRESSWALEVESGSEFFETLRGAYHKLLEDGDELDVDGRRSSEDDPQLEPV